MPHPTELKESHLLTPRRVIMLVLLGLFAVAAILPAFLLKDVAEERSADPAYQALTAYAKSYNGDKASDKAAAQAVDTFKRSDLGGGREQLSRLGADGETCWVLIIEDGPIDPPHQGVSSDCN